MRGSKWILFVLLVVAAISALTDWSFQAAVATVPITNKHSVANAGRDQTVATGATVVLDGSHSTDVAGAGLAFKWSFVSVPAGSAAMLSNSRAVAPTFLADRPGTYVVQLVVN